jgi:tetratricopeptide (TPR) repeat protein
VTLRRVVIAALLGVTGCAGYASYSSRIDEALVHEDYSAALEVVEKISRSNSELLYCYEKALVLRAQGEYAASNETFERAEVLLEDLYTRSVTREVASLTVSETITQYRGDAFEAIRVNYYKILNYLALDDVDGAVVECRRLSRKLQMLHDGGETYFVDDPSWVLDRAGYEMGGESESAGVVRTAAAGYHEPAAAGRGRRRGCTATRVRTRRKTLRPPRSTTARGLRRQAATGRHGGDRSRSGGSQTRVQPGAAHLREGQLERPRCLRPRAGEPARGRL